MYLHLICCCYDNKFNNKKDYTTLKEKNQQFLKYYAKTYCRITIDVLHQASKSNPSLLTKQNEMHTKEMPTRETQKQKTKESRRKQNYRISRIVL